MARFPIDESKLPGLGKALAKAVTDPAAKQALKDDPKSYLIAAGVDQGAIQGLNFNVAEDTSTTINLVIPSAIDEGKVNGNDTDYLVGLGTSVTLVCVY